MAADLPPEPAGLPTPAPAAARPLKGILLVVLATLAFALADTMTKDLSMRHPVPVVLAARFLINLVLLIAFLGPNLGAGLWRTRRTGLVVMRGLSLVIASTAMSTALRVMPVAEAVAIVYLSPFIVMLVAIPLLGEKVSLVGWASAVVGFAGVLLIARPGGGLDPTGVALTLAAAVLTSGYQLMTRLLVTTESTVAMLFQTALVGSVVFSAAAMGSLGEVSLTLLDIGKLSLLGTLATVGHFLFTAAYREASASLLAPVNYLHLFWAGGLGFVVFGHLPHVVTIAGMLLVCAAGIVVAVWSYVARGRG